MEELKNVTEHTSKSIDFLLVLSVILSGVLIIFLSSSFWSFVLLVWEIIAIILIASNREKIFKNFEIKWKKLKNFF